jgi:hypothetical protein
MHQDNVAEIARWLRNSSPGLASYERKIQGLQESVLRSRELDTKTLSLVETASQVYLRQLSMNLSAHPEDDTWSDALAKEDRLQNEARRLRRKHLAERYSPVEGPSGLQQMLVKDINALLARPQASRVFLHAGLPADNPGAARQWESVQVAS